MTSGSRLPWIATLSPMRRRASPMSIVQSTATASAPIAAIDSSQTAALVTNALGTAIANRDPQAGGIIHSDHGVQGGFTSWAFTDRAKRSGLVPSMGSIGDCYDNAMIESFWGRMQTELLNRKRWKSRIELANATFEYVEIFHNRQRVDDG
jgi:transposase InsO family protein